MKKIILAGCIIALLALHGKTNAQSNKEKKDKKVSIQIITEDNGKKTVIDTTFDAKDDAAIESFLKAHDVKKTLPPIPPVPPSPPRAPNAPTPPSPPSPPDINDPNFSYEFNFDEDDMDEIRDNINDEMDNVRDQIELAKEEIKQSLKAAKISKEEMEHLREEINKELDNIDIKVDGDKKHKHITIHKKTGSVDKGDDQWNTNAFVTGNGQVVKCITKDGDKTNCRLMVITGNEVKENDGVNSDVVKSEKKIDKDPEARKEENKTTADNNQLNPDDFKIYPNPNTGSFDLKFHLDTHGKTTINIIDASGKEVFSESFADFTGDYDKHIDLPAKGKGTYLLNVKQDDKWMHKKVVIK